MRSVIRGSFGDELVEFKPDPSAAARWQDAKGRFASLVSKS
jgi:hypothetical protein